MLLLLSGATLCADVVTRVDDEKVVGTVTALDSAGDVVVQTGGPAAPRTVAIPAAEVLSVRFDAKPAAAAAGDLVVLSSGERCRVTLRSEARTPGVAKLLCEGADALHGRNDIPFADLRAWLPRREGLPPGDADRDLREILILDNDRDVVLMTNQDRITAVVEWLAPGEVRVTGKLGPTAVKRELIRGVAFSKTLKPYREPARLLAEVYLADGSVLLGDIAGPKDGACAVWSVLGPAWSAPADRIVEVRFRGGKLLWLSDLKPAKEELTPFFNRTWPWQKDRSVWGGALTAGGVVYERGLATHSRTELTYDIAAQFVTFLADVAIDDETKGTGSAVVSVTGDGRVLLAPVEVSAGEKPRRVKLDVAGLRQLKLLVDFGRNEDTGDHVDWLNARLIRK